MPPQPIYTRDSIKAAYQLRYDWTGWPSSGTLPFEPDEAFFGQLALHWEMDGIRLLERRWQSHQVHLFTSVKPSVSPQFFSARMKGRLQHALRKNDTFVKFSRKVSMRTVGDTKTAAVERYIENQAVNEDLADPEFRKFLERFTVINEGVDLELPAKTNSGRYWYNLHLVFVLRKKFWLTDAVQLGKLRDGCLRIAELKDHRISRLAVMPDHLHIALRGNTAVSPEDIALNFMNNLAFLLRQDGLWQPSYYVGGFAEYDMDAIRRHSVL
jgi:REP element-mobilizing transposase RayT